MKSPLLISSIFLFFFLCATSVAQAQWKLSTQLGGANFLGATLNVGYEYNLASKIPSSLEAQVGYGFLLPSHGPNTIINTQLKYKLKQYGLGLEAAFFHKKPFYKEGFDQSDFLDLLLYPNFSYTLPVLKSFFINFSAGCYLAFSRESIDYFTEGKLVFEGDPIPGAGLTFGYIF